MPPQNQQMSIEQFGQTIKAKYPQYNDLQDAELGQKMLAKYPVYQDMIKQEQPQENFLQKLGGYAQKGLNFLFPAEETGKAIGGAMAKLGLTGLNQQERRNVDTSFSPLKVAGELGQNALTIATAGGLGSAEGIGVKGALQGLGATGEKLGTQIAANAGLGAGFGLTNAMAQGQNTEGTLGNVALGAATGAAIPPIAKGIQWITDNLPQRIVRSALNQPKGELMGGKDISQYVLQNKKLGTVGGMLDEAQSAVKSLGGQVDSILAHPDYTGEVVKRSQLLDTILQSFPNSTFTPDQILEKMQTIAPKVGKLLGKEDLTPIEANAIRKEIGRNVGKAWLRLDNPITKEIGQTAYGALRKSLTNIAPELDPILAKESKEITLKNALFGLDKSKMSRIGLYDILATAGGYAAHGPLGALTGIAMERGIRNPTIDIAGAKLLNQLGKTAPIGGTVKAGLFNALMKLHQ